MNRGDRFPKDDGKPRRRGASPFRSGQSLRRDLPPPAKTATTQGASPRPPAGNAPPAVAPTVAAPVAAPAAAPRTPRTPHVPDADARSRAWAALAALDTPISPELAARARLISTRRDDPVAAAFDVLRTRLMGALRQRGWKRVGITSPTRGCGKTFTSLNLALSLSRMSDRRTVLLDMDLRLPALATRLELTGMGAMRDMLTGAVAPRQHLLRLGENLALGLSDSAAPDAAELLQSSRTRQVLDEIQATLDPDLILCDLPPALSVDDVTALLPRLDTVLLVADGSRTIAREIAECERLLEGQLPLLGVVLNRAESGSGEDYGYGYG